MLGWVTTKFGQMERKDTLKRGIDKAAKYAHLEVVKSARSPSIYYLSSYFFDSCFNNYLIK